MFRMKIIIWQHKLYRSVNVTHTVCGDWLSCRYFMIWFWFFTWTPSAPIDPFLLNYKKLCNFLLFMQLPSQNIAVEVKNVLFFLTCKSIISVHLIMSSVQLILTFVDFVLCFKFVLCAYYANWDQLFGDDNYNRSPQCSA